MFTDFPYIPVFCSNERLFMPIKNTFVSLLDKIKQPLYWFYQWIGGKNYTLEILKIKDLKITNRDYKKTYQTRQ